MVERVFRQRLLLNRRGFLASGLGMLSLGGCATMGPAWGPASPDAASVVEMTLGLDFIPNQVTVREGELVEWRNHSPFTHTVTADPEKAQDPEHVRLPPGVQPFNSGPVAAGELFRHTFMVAGSYRYFCIPHEGMGMVGSVIVQPRE